MSTPDRDELGVLLEAHALRSLTADEETRLRALASTDPVGAAELEEVETLHAMLDAERQLRVDGLAPTTATEEADEGFRRLQRVAAASEDGLRARMLHGRELPASEAPRGGSVPRLRFLLWGAAAAALIAMALFLSDRGGQGPALIDGRPDGDVLGTTARIILHAGFSVECPELSWHPVVGASRYDAVIEDVEGRALFSRPQQRARSTVWVLTGDQVEVLCQLRDAGAQPYLRIVARDGAGLAVASSGDLPLRIVD